MPVLPRSLEIQGEISAIRRDIHAHPELAYEENRTSDIVAAKLQEWGLEVTRGLGKTGLVGTLRKGNSVKSIGLRADMDALPMDETNDFAHRSRNQGRMHACGHDGHTAMLLGAARYLAETRNFAGTVHLIFQPAEEKGGGGRVMIEDGLFERFPVDQVFGLHNWPYIPTGSFAMCAGPAMAASDELTITIAGKACHAAMPHRGKDPVVASALLIQALQPLVAREVDPLDNAVVSITRIAGGHAYNIVPDRVELWGTIRTFDEATRDRLIRRVEEVARGVGLAQGVTISVTMSPGYPATVNTAREAALGADVAAEIVGEAQVDRAPAPSMAAEDFAFILRQRPGSYIWLGTGVPDAPTQLHSPHYDFNDAALPIGVSYWVRLVERLLPARA